MTSVLGQVFTELAKLFDDFGSEEQTTSVPENPFVEREREREELARAKVEPEQQEEPGVEKQAVREESPLEKWQSARARVTENAQKRQEDRHTRMRQTGFAPHVDRVPEEHRTPVVEDTGFEPMPPTPEDFTPTPREAHGPPAPPTKHAAPPTPGSTPHGKAHEFSENMTNFAEATVGAMEQLNERLSNVMQRLENLESAIEARDME